MALFAAMGRSYKTEPHTSQERAMPAKHASAPASTQ